MKGSLIHRKSRDYVTIAHVSDLHLRAKSEAEYKDFNFHLASFGEHLSKQSVDLICVTGDIADNPFKSLLNRLTEKPTRIITDQMSEWVKNLDEVFLDARLMFEDWCRKASISTNSALLVIPGNHDKRLQGFIPNMTIGEARYSEEALSSFLKVFKVQFDARHIEFSHPEGAPITVKLACIDSNCDAPIANFARGAVSIEKMVALHSDLGAEPLKIVGGDFDYLNSETFRICLVHHHPLPISDDDLIKSERDQPRDTNAVQFATWLLSRFFPSIAPGGSAVEKLQGNMTTAFDNAGIFIANALTCGVNLVLHGHQHRHFFRAIEHPDTDNFSRLLVAGAGSLRVPIDGKCHYNLVRLYANGNITVENRTIIVNDGPKWKSGAAKMSMDPPRLRGYRHAARLTEMRRRQIEVATAQSYTRIVRIRPDGSAEYEISIEALESVNGSFKSLFLTSLDFGDEPGNLASVTISGVNTKVEESTPIRQERLQDRVRLSIEFSRNIFRQERVVNVLVRFNINNIYPITSTKYETEIPTFLRCKEVVPVSMRQVIVFPSAVRPRGLDAVVRDDYEREDLAETEYARASLIELPNENICALSIDRPLPGLRYGITWTGYDCSTGE